MKLTKGQENFCKLLGYKCMSLTQIKRKRYTNTSLLKRYSMKNLKAILVPRIVNLIITTKVTQLMNGTTDTLVISIQVIEPQKRSQSL